MPAFLLEHEASVRLAAFALAFGSVAAWEFAAPRRALSVRRRIRWTGNFALAMLNSVALRLVFPAAAVGVAWFAQRESLGWLHHSELPQRFRIAIALVALDLAIYLQHVLFHAVPALWRLHRVHHGDVDFDVTTGFRFHVIEILLSMLYKSLVVAALGAPVLAVLLFELLLSSSSLFNHANARMPGGLDRALRWILVTPDMHRVHHSVAPGETNSNFGFTVPWWDRLFGTYRAQPAAGHEAMTIGVEGFRGENELRLDRMLLQPFRGGSERYSIPRRTESAR